MSFLLNQIPLAYRLLGLIVLAVALMAFGWVKGAESAQARFDKLEVQRGRDEIAALNKLAGETKRLQLKKDGALHAANDRAIAIEGDADAARAVFDSLRSDLADARSKLAGASCESIRARTAALQDVFEQCTSRYRDVAEKADRHASDALMFEQAWPK